MRTWALVVAAGAGTRFGAPKQFAELAGRPVLAWSLEVARLACDGVTLVLPPGHARAWDADSTTTGGATRSESVRRGLGALPEDAGIVVVHDAARPLAPLGLWQAVIDAVAAGADAAIPGAQITDTVKEVGPGGHLSTLDRSRLVAVQTPQAFRAGALKAAHEGRGEATDDAALVEACGGRVVVVPAPGDNVKITSPQDLPFLEALLRVRP